MSESELELDAELDAELFDVLFRGEIQAGQNVEQVKQRVGAIFKLDEAKLERLFSGQTPYLKRNTDITSADKILCAMEHAGAIAEVIACVVKPQILSMAPLGTNVLPEQESESGEGADACARSGETGCSCRNGCRANGGPMFLMLRSTPRSRHWI